MASQMERAVSLCPHPLPAEMEVQETFIMWENEKTKDYYRRVRVGVLLYSFIVIRASEIWILTGAYEVFTVHYTIDTTPYTQHHTHYTLNTTP